MHSTSDQDSRRSAGQRTRRPPRSGSFPGPSSTRCSRDALLAGSQGASRDALLRVLLSGGLLILLSLLPAIARPRRSPSAGRSCDPHTHARPVPRQRRRTSHFLRTRPSLRCWETLVAQPDVDYAALVQRKSGSRRLYQLPWSDRDRPDRSREPTRAAHLLDQRVQCVPC